ncbi:hypothetical protein A1O7_02640 [Cladophialophora yegresii CBS 114405]|uniref:Transcription factor domain-containing protein n=1 Tax=Cladophialophora yegresii CBS 114405 TaxID=1182544 RepID=W9W2B3_9EURO|nr:uncharacterized protein A1O7_02640 [Cladophialophora yegresii CBS 114405]EXJ62207.1 hypothetical protein A1O7_02640 [Cladophialophora yegresii CBS 114405]
MRPMTSQLLVLRGRRDAIAQNASESSHRGRQLPQNVSPFHPDPEQEITAEDSHASKRQRARQCYDRTPSPRVYLDDRVIDRFSALPTDLPREVVTEQLYNSRQCFVEMITNVSSRDVYGPRFAHHILSMAVRNPVLLYSMMSAAMLFMRVAQKSERNYMLELQVNATAVRLLSEQMRNPQTAATEANIWAVVALGYSGYVGEIRTGKCPRQSFLKELQSLHIYGRLVINKVHVAGLMQLVQMLGGVDKITTPGMAQVICFADLFESSRCLRRTFMPFVPHTRLYLEADRLAVSVAEREWAESTMGSLATSFTMVWPDPGDDALLALLVVIRDMADFTVVVDNYVEGRFVPRPPVMLTDQRNYVQHRLMSLESLEEIESRRTAPADLQYEACRLACIAYSFLVIFPFPPVVGLFERLAKRLQISLLQMRTGVDASPYARVVMQLWILTLGAVVSIGLPERAWFVDELLPVMVRLGVDSWGQMERLLRGFLWHPKTSERDGLDVYRDVKLKAHIVPAHAQQ